MFERFSQDARRVVVRARHEAVRAGRGQLGCEHLLLGLLAEPGPAAAAMTAAGLELGALRAGLSRGSQAEPERRRARFGRHRPGHGPAGGRRHVRPRRP